MKVIYIASIFICLIPLILATADINSRLRAAISEKTLKAVIKRRNESFSSNLLRLIKVLFAISFFPFNIVLGLMILMSNTINQTYEKQYEKLKDDADKFGIKFELNFKDDDLMTAMEKLDNLRK